MRFITLLRKIEENDTNQNSGNEDIHIYDTDLYDKLQWFTKEYDRNEKLRKVYNRIKKYSHPFDTIRTEISTSLIPNSPKLKITNAFMKMYEMMIYLQNHLKLKDKQILTMYDVAGAPGMFVLGVEKYLKDKYPNITLDWQACSLVGDKALVDLYSLYRSNPDRFMPCNVLNEKDIKTCIAKGKYDLVTGDIGYEHDDDFSKLQEETHLDLQWGQMILALNLSATNGCMILKMYTYITEESTYLVDTLTKYFDQVYICKPYTSRIINDESYIICLNRNDTSCSDLPLLRPRLMPYTSPNLDLFTAFSNSYADLKMAIVSLLSRLLIQNPNISFKEVLKCTAYQNLLYNSIKKLNFLFYGMDP